ncbi:MAG: hypothetical protein ACFFDW_00095 [Candidatus Thorarchaeota archaeon]
MSSRGGINTLNGEQSKSAKPVFTKIVKESLKSIILSGESELEKFVSHRILYFFGFLTGWNPKIFSLEILPISYFFIWSIVLFALKEIAFGVLFLVSAMIVFLYFILLHSVISAWDRIRHWFIKRAIKRGGISNMNLDDIRFLLVYTRKIFGVKTSIEETSEKELNIEKFRYDLIAHRNWQRGINISVILTMILVTGIGIYGFIIEANILDWLCDWWFIIIILLFPTVICAIGTTIYRGIIRQTVNDIPADKFEEILKILNEFQIFGGKK